MPSTEDHAQNASDDSDEQRAYKQIGRHREHRARLAHAAEIEDSDDDQNAHAKGNHVGQQGRNGRDQSADSRGNSHGGRENVIGKQRGRGQQAGRRAKVKPRHRVGATAGGIGRDGLAIREVNDHQQRDDGSADGNDITNAQQTQRDQQAEGRFRPVSGGAKAIQTKDGNALRGSDLFRPFVAGLYRFADNHIKDVHEG